MIITGKHFPRQLDEDLVVKIGAATSTTILSVKNTEIIVEIPKKHGDNYAGEECDVTVTYKEKSGVSLTKFIYSNDGVPKIDNLSRRTASPVLK